MQRLKHILHSHWAVPALLALLVLVAGPVLAQQSNNGYDQTWHTVEPGQVVGDLTTGYGLRGVIGQPEVSTSTDSVSGGDYLLTSGFLSPSINPRNPTAVGLEWFTVVESKGGMVLTWQTATEVATSGFYVQHQGNNGAWERRSAFISTQGDSVTGARYTFTDSVGTTASRYRLEVVSADGTHTFYVPTSEPRESAQDNTQLYLPVVQ